MDELVDTLRNRKENVDWVNPWHRDFRDYVNQFKSTNQSFKVLLISHDNLMFHYIKRMVCRFADENRFI